MVKGTIVNENGEETEGGEMKALVDDNGDPVFKDIKVLWLPTKHCHLNPIEMVWAWIKVCCDLHIYIYIYAKNVYIEV